VLEYIFRVELTDESDVIQGLTTIDLRFDRPGIVELPFDLIGLSADEASGMTVSGVWVAGSPARRQATAARVVEEDRGVAANFEHTENRLLIELPSPSTPGQRLFVTVSYSGIPAAGLEIGDTKHGDRSFFSENWPDKARHWLPTIDHPYDKALGRMVVTAPSHYQVVSNGLLAEETDLDDSTRMTEWKQSVPIATWLYTLGVARFAVQQLDDFDGIPVQTWVFRQDRDDGFYDFAIPTHDVLEFFSDQIGSYSYEKLANIQSNSVSGGMESASAVFYGDDSVSGERTTRWRNVIIHELAHQWFGNAVTESDWDDVWLSEGFATYFTHLYIEHAYGHDEFIAGLESDRDRIYEYYEKHPDYRLVHDNLDDMTKVLTRMQYIKGAWTLHMLRDLVGTENFQDGIREYYRLYREGNASTADFRRVMEETSGQEIGWLLDQWLYQGGLPVVEGTWGYDPDQSTVQLHLAQVQQSGYRFRLPMVVRVHAEDGSFIDALVDLTQETGNFSIAVEDEPANLELDPDTWVLMRSSLRQK
jgi:aminopeptidase N